MMADRRLAHGFLITASYTFSRGIDSKSEVVPAMNSPALASLPIDQGGLKIDRALSDYHRKHRLTLSYIWEIPGPTHRIWKQFFSGWALAGITTFQSGAPFTLGNGFDRNNDGNPNNDRPDIGNPNAPLHTRAVVAPTAVCATGFRNPDTNACVTPADVRFVEGRGLPNRGTVGRNTLFAGKVNNFDVNIFKTFSLTEAKRLEFGLQTSNFFNHPQFTNVPAAGVLGTPGP